MADLSHVNRVLLVEDEALIALDVEMALRDAGVAEIITALSIDEAHNALNRQPPCAGVLDLHLGSDGLGQQIAERLRAAGIPFVFSSGSADRPDGFEDVPIVAKPFSSDAIVAALRHVTGFPAMNEFEAVAKSA